MDRIVRLESHIRQMGVRRSWLTYISQLAKHDEFDESIFGHAIASFAGWAGRSTERYASLRYPRKSKLRLVLLPLIFAAAHQCQIFFIGFALMLREPHTLAPIVISEQAFTNPTP
jgi:hypothetical protein